MYDVGGQRESKRSFEDHNRRSSRGAFGLPLDYKGLRLETAYRIDLLVENIVIVEVKAVDQLGPIHQAQLLTYLKLKQLWLGLLINFNTVHLKGGIKRVVHG